MLTRIIGQAQFHLTKEPGNLVLGKYYRHYRRWHECNFFPGQTLGLEAAALLCQLNTVTEIIRLEMRVFFKRSKGECDLFLRFAWDNVDKGWLVMPENEVRTTFKAKTQALCSCSSQQPLLVWEFASRVSRHNAAQLMWRDQIREG